MQGGDGGVVTPRGGGHDHLAAIFHIRTHIQISFSGVGAVTTLFSNITT